MTPIIVRYLVGGDPGQAARARGLIDNSDVFVCTTVLLETEWVLRSVYGFAAVQCAEALSDFTGLPRANLEDVIAAAKALGWMRQGVDFADGPHLAKAEGFEAFICFDQDFAKAANALGGIKVRAALTAWRCSIEKTSPIPICPNAYFNSPDRRSGVTQRTAYRTLNRKTPLSPAGFCLSQARAPTSPQIGGKLIGD
ncbi:type II toxin-antitoxin system VapC family toxin [Bradyrhizobium manausense]|uniref:type II toxin-antitoxin system VapC family toxin n=1 Tax=Bradyrhizobium manausense TaxID=989370 RepID=UPI0007C71D24|nr:type II toxin-antitoxin system VapC family toxin [Bradyrhizobium manausense]